MRKKRAIKVASVLLLLYAFVGFVLPPFLLKSQVVKILDENLQTKSSIGSLFFNPFSFRLTLDDVALKNKKNNKDIISFSQLRLNLDPTSLIVGVIDIDEFLLQHPYVHLIRERDRTLNLAHLLKTSKQKPKKSPKKSQTSLPKIHIGSFAIEDGMFEFDDRSLVSAYHTKFSPITFRLKDIDTSAKDADGKIGFYAKIGLDGYLDIQAKLHSSFPLVADGVIKIQANQLYEQWRYVRDFLNLEVADGHISVDGSFHIDQNSLENMEFQFDKIALQKLRIKPKERYKDLLTLKELALYDTSLYPLQQKLSIEKISLDKLDLKAKRDKEGSIDWQSYLQTSFPKSKKETKPSASKPWQVSVKEIKFSDIGATFNDALVTPAVTTTLNRMDIHVKNFVLGSKEPFVVHTDILLNERLRCSDDAVILQTPLQLKSSLRCKDFDITHYNPYIDFYAKKALKRFDLHLKSAVSDLSADATLQERNATLITKVKNANFALRDVKLTKKSTKEKLLSWKAFKLADIEYNGQTNQLNIGDVALKNATFTLKRYKNKKLNVIDLIKPKENHHDKKSKKESSSSMAFAIKKVHIDNALISFMDMALERPTKTRLDHIGIQLKNISSNLKSSISYHLYTKLNKKGTIQTRGTLRQKPLHLSSSFNLKDIALLDFSPYVEEFVDAHIADGRLSFRGKASYAPSKRDPDLDLKGDLTLRDFAVAKSHKQQYIFGLNKVGVKDLVIQTAPDRAYVNEVDVDGLYVDAFLDENKTLNFAKLLKKQPKEEDNTTKSKKKSKPFPFMIAKVAIANSNAMFADYSLPIRFKTEIHELEGGIYAISNNPKEVSFIDLKGAVDKYGSMKLKGNIQSAKLKEFTDIEMHFRNLDMSALSGYSAQFAGYKIKNGKLFVDLKYKIEHSQMVGENALLIKNIHLGDEIEDENITHLPLGLAIALLEDSDGVIDIEMPVEGNVDAPDFKYGRVVLKALANLIVKAVASPFKFLGSALGIDAEELASLEFEYGSSLLLPSELEKLDKMAQILAKRPKIAFSFTPTYDQKRDTYALKLHMLVAKLLKESKIKNDEDLQNALSIELLEEIFLQAHTDKALKKMQTEVHKAYKDENLYQVKYRERLLKACVMHQPLQKSSLLALAKERYKAVFKYLVEQKGIKASRLSLKESVAASGEDEKFAPMKVDIKVIN